jgi:polyferredoxin
MNFKNKNSGIILPISVFVFIFILLSVIQIKVHHPMLILEIFINGGGWFEIIIISGYGALVSYKMQNPINVPKWRKATWLLFSCVFFLQLILGLSGIEKFLMTGKLHLPIPMMIIAGPIYREQLSIMTLMFLSTIILTGPAWCSHFCYFGAIDSLASNGKTNRNPLKNKFAIKTSILFLVILVTLLLKWMNVNSLITTIIAGLFGITGIFIILIISRKKGKMIHCTMYCPVGTLVNVFKYANPFKLYIDTNCTMCMKCTSFCKYDALNPLEIKNKKPSITCTLCGDCLAACKDNAIKYKYLKLSANHARNFYLFLTISLHAVCLALARI